MKRTIHVLGCLLAVLVCGQAVAGQSPIKPVSAICVEAESGLVLFQQDADVPRPPASMVKLMMMLLVAEGVEGGTWTLQQPIAISTYASSMGGTQVFLKAGEVWPLAKMMDAVAVASANDGAVAVAEGLWGTLAKYLETANRRALELGMIDTVYRSANGLPPDNGRDFDLTTARDMAVLARACVQHDMIMRWVGQREFQFRETDALKSNTNKLLWRMPDCDGMKTGYIRAAGFCITATAQRGGVRLISVVMGNPSKYDRFNQAQQLLEGGFRNVRKLRLVAQGQSLGKPVPVNNCATP
ncbi:MAG: D-alanyl-D-alanine carboxypeptidase, partial [Candidatus Hydrogenedentes bacterium]|nr:D-alanyl-D-alanine carboxypeptidase [Candidatus Hydrogenedentota bacterium]